MYVVFVWICSYVGNAAQIDRCRSAFVKIAIFLYYVYIPINTWPWPFSLYKYVHVYVRGGRYFSIRCQRQDVISDERFQKKRPAYNHLVENCLILSIVSAMDRWGSTTTTTTTTARLYMRANFSVISGPDLIRSWTRVARSNCKRFSGKFVARPKHSDWL